ncbi:MAG TPA: hypothetical protein VK742_01105 [Candidatus Sulfotelmatobacter sp.]|jgi:hypothetical protein|nr:hypothetical protein [Candidatus Sulfotelmatobacter sp.]
MKITTTIEIPEPFIEKIVRGIMDNFPEASRGCTLVCASYKYEAMAFLFKDEESGTSYYLDRQKLLAAFPLLFTEKWPKGCTPPPISASWDDWENWLCQSDATDDDAFVQLACLGEVIYG